jgi:hypothetical protein
MDTRGHAVGSHGGWIHDFYGVNANESNQAQFEPYLALNANAVDTVIGRPARSYSAPEGNNPTWAMDWLETHGIVGAYFAGHTGLGPTRHWRDGALRNPKLAVFPVTPQGMYATFEEFQAFSVPKEAVMAWYHDLVDFSIQSDTSRLVYAHPPGASVWPDVLQDMLAYASGRGTAFRWYTMPRLADHMAKRMTVNWSQTRLANGDTRFNASNAAGLSEIVWRVPKSRYLKPAFSSIASGTVGEDASDWLVKPAAVTSIEFTAKPAA